MPTKPLSKWLTNKAGKKPIGATPLDNQSDAKRVNNYDRDSGQAVTDGFSESDPNAMGPRMRPLYDATAGAFTSAPEYVVGVPGKQGAGQLNGKYNGADMHTDYYEAPYPRRQTGAAAVGGIRGTKTGDDERTGVSGKWPDSDT